MMSAMYKKISLYYKRGYWSAERVAEAVVKGWITAEEYETITGEAYSG